MTAKCIRRQKNIIYKRAEFTQPGLVLETLLQQAFDIHPKPAQRRQQMGTGEVDSNVRHVIGASTHEQSMLCGSFLSYEIGKDVTFVVEDEEADEFIIESQNPAPDLEEGDNRKREVLQSALYFGVYGEHVVLVQSPALKSREFEGHLKWLLSEHAGVLPVDAGISLSDEPTQTARQAIENLPVKSVEIGTPVTSEEVVAGGHNGTSQNVRHKLSGKAVQALSAFLGQDVLAQLDLESTLDESNLEVTLQLRYKRSTTESGHAALDHIARSMRHAEPEDTRVMTKSGAVIRGEQLKLTGQISVGTYNGVVDTADLYTQMHSWLDDRIAEGAVG